MDDQLKQLEEWAAPLLRKIGPAEQRKLTRSIALELRRSQVKRIGQQRNPDGSAFEPRKRQLRGNSDQDKAKRSIREMFGKIRKAKHLKVLRSNQGAAIGIIGRSAKIARVHQYGLRDAVRPGGPTVQYPERVLLGFSELDREKVLDLLLEHLAH